MSVRLALVWITFLSACAPLPSGVTEFESGAVDLYYTGMPSNTRNLQSYFRELCLQAHPLNRPDADGTLSCPSLNDVVAAGFNDISFRCESYLGWVMAKRDEGARVRSGLSTTQALLVGALRVPADSLRAIAVAFGLGNAAYDAANTSRLVGLSDVNIVKIVRARSAAYRTEFAKINYSSYPDAVYALRGYLNICTPQSIMLSANDYVSAGVSGLRGPDLQALARQEAAVLTSAPLTSGAAANSVPDRGRPKALDACRIFDFSGCTEADVKEAQTALCQPPDGQITQTTEAGIREFEANRGAVNGRLSPTEFAVLTARGCDGKNDAGARSYYERAYLMNPGALTIVAEQINATLKRQAIADPYTVTLDSQEFRKAVIEVRAALGLTSSVGNEWVTKALSVELNKVP